MSYIERDTNISPTQNSSTPSLVHVNLSKPRFSLRPQIKIHIPTKNKDLSAQLTTHTTPKNQHPTQPKPFNHDLDEPLSADNFWHYDKNEGLEIYNPREEWEKRMDKSTEKWWTDRLNGIDYTPPWCKKKFRRKRFNKQTHQRQKFIKAYKKYKKRTIVQYKGRIKLNPSDPTESKNSTNEYELTEDKIIIKSPVDYIETEGIFEEDLETFGGLIYNSDGDGASEYSDSDLMDLY
jgi:hypothetical protein